MRRPLVVIGDTLLDTDVEGSVTRLCQDSAGPVVDVTAERTRPGGAGLAAMVAARSGRSVVLVTPVARDQTARRLRRMLDDAGVEVVAVPVDGTTVEKVRVRHDGRTLLRLDRGRAGRPSERLDDEVTAAVRSAGALLVADYGRGMTAHPEVRELLAANAARHPIVWDPHPRGTNPVPGARLVTPNHAEAAALAGAGDTNGPARAPGWPAAASHAEVLRRRWSATAVAVTLGSRGALVCTGEAVPLVVPPSRVVDGDGCGAGDAFAAGAAGALLDGAVVSEAVEAGVAVAEAFVAYGLAGPAKPEPGDGAVRESVSQVVARVRGAGGTVVATGGCFDLVHPGHVELLGRARTLGDCLVVLVNSDESVRRLKGPGRPVLTEADRVQVLQALSSVDGVVVFGEDTPAEALEQLRPDVWVKGADYGEAALPEAKVVASWGGRCVVVPYLSGHSTSRLIEMATGERQQG